MCVKILNLTHPNFYPSGQTINSELSTLKRYNHKFILHRALAPINRIDFPALLFVGG